MPDWDFDNMVAHAVDAVLESMFFTASFSSLEEPEAGPALQCRVEFHGEPTGILVLRISTAAARGLAAAFLGENEQSVNETQVGQVICELTNMLCGCIVSQLEKEEHFQLSAPELLSSATDHSAGISANSRQSFAIDNGILTAALFLSVPHEA